MAGTMRLKTFGTEGREIVELDRRGTNVMFRLTQLEIELQRVRLLGQLLRGLARAQAGLETSDFG